MHPGKKKRPRRFSSRQSHTRGCPGRRHSIADERRDCNSLARRQDSDLNMNLATALVPEERDERIIPLSLGQEVALNRKNMGASEI